MNDKLKDLTERAVKNGANGHMLNVLSDAKQYSGILEAVVMAGSMSKLAAAIGVSHQAVQGWVSQGFVPMARITEIEALYGVPRADLMNPKYTAILAEPKFSDEA